MLTQHEGDRFFYDLDMDTKRKSFRANWDIFTSAYGSDLRIKEEEKEIEKCPCP